MGFPTVDIIERKTAVWTYVMDQTSYKSSHVLRFSKKFDTYMKVHHQSYSLFASDVKRSRANSQSYMTSQQHDITVTIDFFVMTYGTKIFLFVQIIEVRDELAQPHRG